jgi:hypothetical protein
MQQVFCLKISNEIEATWHEIEAAHDRGGTNIHRYFKSQQIAEKLAVALEDEVRVKKSNWKWINLSVCQVTHRPTSPTRGKVIATGKRARLCSIEDYWDSGIEQLVLIRGEDLCILPRWMQEVIVQIRKSFQSNPDWQFPLRIKGLGVS